MPMFASHAKAVFRVMLAACLGLAGGGVAAWTAQDEVLETIAFGSCLRQGRPQPVWDALLAAHPDVFLFIGDNVYADTEDPVKRRESYARLAAQPGFQRLKAQCPLHATWDDHDYGQNDGGADFPAREASQRAFQEFFGVAPEARGRPGVYGAHTYGPKGRRVQLILLDTRYFRSPLQKIAPSWDCPRVNHGPVTDPDATILGEDQWAWLEARLREPAELRIIASSIQVIPAEHCYEKWANFPLERLRLFELIRRTGAQGVVLVSGDRHLAEISRLESTVVGYPLYELTASGMNSAGAGKGERNRHRVGADNFREDNFGLIRIDWSQADARVTLEVRDAEGAVGLIHRLVLSELRPTP